MSRRRKLHKVPGVTQMVSASAMAPKREFVTNGAARAKALTWAVIISFSYGVTNNLILGRAESRVDTEMLVVCAVTLALQIALYHRGSVDFGGRLAWISRLWERIWRFEHWGYAPALTALTLAVFLSLMMFISAPSFQAKVVDLRFDHLTKKILSLEAASASQGELTARFEKVLAAVRTSAALDIPVDAKRVERARNAIGRSLSTGEASEQVKASGWETMAGLGAYADYRRIQQGGQMFRPVFLGSTSGNETIVINSPVKLEDKPAWLTGAQTRVTIGDLGFLLSNARVIFDDIRFEGAVSGAMPIVVNDESSRVLVRNSSFKNVTQGLQRVSWESVQFDHSTILYFGGPVNLYMVRFEDCDLQFGSDRVSQDLKLQILKANGQPISFASGKQ